MEIWFDSRNITEHTRLNSEGLYGEGLLQGTCSNLKYLKINSKSFVSFHITSFMYTFCDRKHSFATNVFVRFCAGIGHESSLSLGPAWHWGQ